MTTQTLEPTQTATVVGQHVHIPGFGYGTITEVRLLFTAWAVIESSGFCHPMRYAVRLEKAEALAREQNHWTPEAAPSLPAADYVIQLAEKAISQPPSVFSAQDHLTDMPLEHAIDSIQYEDITFKVTHKNGAHQISGSMNDAAYSNFLRIWMQGIRSPLAPPFVVSLKDMTALIDNAQPGQPSVTADQYQQIFSALVAERVGNQVANRKLAAAYDLAQARVAELESEYLEQSLAVTDLLPYKGVVEGIRAICDEAYGERLHTPVYDLVYGLGKTFKEFIALHKVNVGLEMELHKLITALDAERERNAVLVNHWADGK